jgi:HAMP domain-containing protein
LVLFASIIQNRADFLALPEETIFPVLESDQARLDLYQFREELVPRTTLMLDLLSDLTNNEFQQMQSELEAGSTGLMRARVSTIVVGVTAVILSVVLSLILRENIAGPIVRLTAVAETIQGGSLDSNAQVESQDEIGILAATFNRMTSQLRSTLRQVRKERDRADNLLNVVIPIGVELSSEQDFNRMLEKMLVEAKTFCNADAGSLYLRTEEDTLRFVIVRNSTQNITLGGTSGQPVTFAPLPLYLDGAPNRQHVATAVALSGETINIANAYETTDYDFSGPPQFDAQTGYHTQSMLTIPLKNSLGDVKGILQLLNAQDQSGAIIPFDANLQQMMESFSSLAVAALEAYIREQVLRQEIQQLRIEIDEAKLQKTVSETVDSDFFQNLQAQAREIRRRRQESREQSEDQSST